MKGSPSLQILSFKLLLVMTYFILNIFYSLIITTQQEINKVKYVIYKENKNWMHKVRNLHFMFADKNVQDHKNGVHSMFQVAINS